MAFGLRSVGWAVEVSEVGLGVELSGLSTPQTHGYLLGLRKGADYHQLGFTRFVAFAKACQNDFCSSTSSLPALSSFVQSRFAGSHFQIRAQPFV